MIGYLLGWCCACKQAKASLFLNWAMVVCQVCDLHCDAYRGQGSGVRGDRGGKHLVCSY